MVAGESQEGLVDSTWSFGRVAGTGLGWQSLGWGRLRRVVAEFGWDFGKGELIGGVIRVGYGFRLMKPEGSEIILKHGESAKRPHLQTRTHTTLFPTQITYI